MIISHRHRFVFTAIPKTGTHSVRQALREQLGPDDLEQVRLFVEKRLPWPELARLGHGHISLAELRPVLGEEMFGDYFKFAFVRNPFERFVSYCAFATSQQAALLLPAGIGSGRSTRQRSNTFGQRGLKAQPLGMAFRRGIEPSIWVRRSAL